MTFCADRCRAVQRFPAVNHPRDPGEIVLDADTDVTGGSEQVGNLLRLVIADLKCDRAARLEPRQIEGGQRPVEVIPVLAAEQRHPRLVLHLRLEGFHLTARDIGRIGDHAVQGGQYRRGERVAEERPYAFCMVLSDIGLQIAEKFPLAEQVLERFPGKIAGTEGLELFCLCRGSLPAAAGGQMEPVKAKDQFEQAGQIKRTGTRFLCVLQNRLICSLIKL